MTLKEYSERFPADPLRPQEEVEQRRRDSLERSRRVRRLRLRLYMAIPALVGVVMLLSELTAPDARDYVVFGGMVLMIPLLSTWSVRL